MSMPSIGNACAKGPDQARDWPRGHSLASPWPGTSQVLPIPGGRDSGRLGFSDGSWHAEAATAADLKWALEGEAPQEKKHDSFCDA